jgi:TRAP-type mannitol/chloroaromatic compound transport system permease small subunit
VDLFYERLSQKRRAIIDLTGSLVLLIPFTLMVFWYGIDFTWQAWDIDEGSGDPGGLPNRWIIKGMIPFSFLAMAISGLGMMLRSINILRGHHPEELPRTTSHIS